MKCVLKKDWTFFKLWVLNTKTYLWHIWWLRILKSLFNGVLWCYLTYLFVQSFKNVESTGSMLQEYLMTSDLWSTKCSYEWCDYWQELSVVSAIFDPIRTKKVTLYFLIFHDLWIQSWENLQAPHARLRNTQRFSRNNITKCIDILLIFRKNDRFIQNNNDIYG